MDIKTLDRKAREVAKQYNKLEQQLLGLIIQLDQKKAFYKLGFSSLFKYLTDALKLSPAMASALINVARKAQEVPELQKQVEAGKLSIYKAQRITPVLTPENSKTWLDLAQIKSHRELEREVAIASPKQAIKEKVKYVPLGVEPSSNIIWNDIKCNSQGSFYSDKRSMSSQDRFKIEECKGSGSLTENVDSYKEKVIIKKDIPRMEIQLGVSESLMLKIRRAQDLESQRNRKNLNLEETLEQVLTLYLEKRDPLKKAQRQKAKGKLQAQVKVESQPEDLEVTSSKPNSPISNKHKSDTTKAIHNKSQCRDVDKCNARAKNNYRQAIPEQLQHQLQLRDQGRCAFVDADGNRCLSQRYLEAHHILPVSRGGKNTLENLQLLCSGHHKVMHSKS